MMPRASLDVIELGSTQVYDITRTLRLLQRDIRAADAKIESMASPNEAVHEVMKHT